MAKTIADYSYTPPTPKKVAWAKIGVIAALLIILIALVVWYFNFREIAKKEGDRTIITAQPGRIISGFPGDIIPEKNVSVESSYSIDAKGASQPVVNYTSALSLEQNLQAYKNYFSVNSWRLITDGSLLSAPYLYAVSKDYRQEANVSFLAAGGKVQVTISILNHAAAN